MKARNGRPVEILAFLILVCMVLGAAESYGQDIRLTRGDRLQLVVPQRQELGRQLVINDNGEVYIPVIGAIVIQGMTMAEAEDVVFRRLREIYPSIQGIDLILVGGESKRNIYVHGEVLRPGKYEFDTPPNVWEAVREAGGTTAQASLTAVRVIRASGNGRRTMIVNLQSSIDTGNFDGLPRLRPGDTVIVPELSVRYQGSGAIRMFGAVLQPAPYTLSTDKRLIDAILAAGGPAENANLGKVKIIRQLPEGSTMTYQIDFNRYLSVGDERHNPLILPDDTVNIPKHGNFFRTLFTDPRVLLGVITASATVTAIILVNN